MTLPAGFIEEIDSYGAECLAGLAAALSSEPEVSVRVNRAKGATTPPGADRVAWCGDGFYLPVRPQFTFDPAMHQGLYYVQDASSMAVMRAVAVAAGMESGRPMVCLDACAAPGGKTTAAMAALPEGSFMVANEYDYRRAAVLAENIAKWGTPDVMVTRGDTARFSRMKECFDLIIADVPCSGEGMMRKDGEAVAQWSPALVAECAVRQRGIVDNLWPALRPGGYMIYSTCTFNRHENEEIVDYICHSLGGVTVDMGLCGVGGIAPAITGDMHCCRFIPGRTRGEGLFMALIKKHGDGDAAMPKPSSKPLTVMSKADAACHKAMDWLAGDYEPVMCGSAVMALPSQWAKWMRNAASWLDVLSAGVQVADIKGRDVIPAQGLALSTALRRDAFASVEVDYATAMAYLHREAVAVEAPVGFVLLTYGGHPLGFVKNLGRRANNLYPASWRVVSPNVPDVCPKVI